MRTKSLIVLVMLVSGLSGCVMSGGNKGDLSAITLLSESAWIRNGEPIDFEGEAWYPTDEIENLLDSEVYALGQHRDTAFFIDRADVKPYSRLYAQFGKNRYRAFEKKL